MYDDKLVEVEVEYFDYVSEEVEVVFSVNVSQDDDVELKDDGS